MAKYRKDLPQLKGGDFITDGGMETTFVFHRGIDLPHFAAFPLLDSSSGREEIIRYLEPYIAVAHARGVGFILDTPTWRSNPDWGPKLGYDDDALDALNHRAIAFAEACRRRWERPATPIVSQRRDRAARRCLQAGPRFRTRSHELPRRAGSRLRPVGRRHGVGDDHQHG